MRHWINGSLRNLRALLMWDCLGFQKCVRVYAYLILNLQASAVTLSTNSVELSSNLVKHVP